jgi:hypothetical protein
MRPEKNNQDLVTSIIYISSIGTCNFASKDLLEFFSLATLIHFQERESGIEKSPLASHAVTTTTI